MKYKFSEMLGYMKPSEIRELLKYASMPDFISFGGGMPNPLTFPMQDLKEIVDDVLDVSGKYALQYGNTGGLPELRTEISKMVMKTEGIKSEENEIIVTSGSQQGLYELGKIFLNRSDGVIVESPTYVGAISAFNANAGKMIPVEMDSEGIISDKVEEKLKSLTGRPEFPRFIYVIPNYQNPTGHTLNLDRRKHLLELSEKYQVPIVEDNPYGELRYSGKKLPSIKSLDKTGENVIYLGTFSKVMCPGLRIGYTVAPEAVISKLNLLKQALDLSSSTFSQYVAAEYLKRGVIYRQVPKTVELYSKKRNVMLNALEEHFPKDSTWSKPDGGMFIWATLDKKINTNQMLKTSIENGVGYVSGLAFSPDGSHTSSMRLNFTFSEEEEIVRGIKKLSNTIKNVATGITAT
ncbi:MAG: aminotransferase-like domain-containing protein [Thermoplasmataceae archaeon]|nr:PLP-dependent aminotransferase family protein [Candidatus Thermoplasmatota archaeon]